MTKYTLASELKQPELDIFDDPVPWAFADNLVLDLPFGIHPTVDVDAEDFAVLGFADHDVLELLRAVRASV